MSKDKIQFSHANGFPGESYQTLYRYLEDDYDISYIDTLGHDPQFPITNNWPYLIEELICDIKSKHTEPVIAVGHSLGGVLSLFASCQHPELFKAVILLDAPILGFPKAHLLKVLKKLQWHDHYVLGGQSVLRRTRVWGSVDEVIQHCSRRTLFKSFDQRCLQDYATYGTVEVGQGQRALKIAPEVEYKIYQTFPDKALKFRRASVPCCTILGQFGTMVDWTTRCFMRKRYNMRFEWVPGGHLFPFEYPQASARAIKKSISELIKE